MRVGIFFFMLKEIFLLVSNVFCKAKVMQVSKYSDSGLVTTFFVFWDNFVVLQGQKVFHSKDSLPQQLELVSQSVFIWFGPFAVTSKCLFLVLLPILAQIQYYMVEQFLSRQFSEKGPWNTVLKPTAQLGQKRQSFSQTINTKDSSTKCIF